MQVETKVPEKKALLEHLWRGWLGGGVALQGSLDIALRRRAGPYMRQGNSAENFSMLRHIAFNLILQDKTTEAGVKNRR